LHAKYNVGDKTQLRASYARGYRTPSLKELYLQFIDQNHTIIGNEDLKPETGQHLELGIDRQALIGKGNLNVGFTIYHNEIKNLITLAVFNNQGILRVYENIASYKNWMTNVQAKYQQGNMSVQSGFGMIFVQASSIVPQHQIAELTLNGTYLIKKLKSSINLNYKYNSKQPVLTTDEQYLFTSPLHIANASIQRRFFNNSLNVQAGVKNLFNIQTATLTGGVNTQSSGHTSAAGMQVFPMRSLFFDINYSF
jgi:outer membrane receptor for ferrienterochelin and colicins